MLNVDCGFPSENLNGLMVQKGWQKNSPKYIGNILHEWNSRVFSSEAVRQIISLTCLEAKVNEDH